MTSTPVCLNLSSPCSLHLCVLAYSLYEAHTEPHQLATMSTSWHARIQNQMLDVLNPEAAQYREVHPTEALTLSLEEQPSSTLVALTELAQLGEMSAVGLHTVAMGCRFLLLLLHRCSCRPCMNDRARVALTFASLSFPTPMSHPRPAHSSALCPLSS